jgi:hypothetical protein
MKVVPKNTLKLLFYDETFIKFNFFLDFVYWGHNPSNKTPAIEIPDYHSTLMRVPWNNFYHF